MILTKIMKNLKIKFINILEYIIYIQLNILKKLKEKDTIMKL